MGMKQTCRNFRDSSQTRRSRSSSTDKITYYLVAELFEEVSRAEEDCAHKIRDLAMDLLEQINGSAALFVGDFHPIEVHGVCYLNSNGKLDQYVMPAGISSRARIGSPTIVVAGASPTEPPRPVAEVLQVAEHDSNVRRVLRFWSSGARNWAALYKIHEIIREDVGKGGKELIEDWFPDWKCFRDTANSPEILGDDARHGVPKNDPPENPLSIEEARHAVQTLIRKWLQHKQGVQA